MRIAEMSGIREAVPPTKYGGAEYVASLITEGLVSKKHDVTLFATGDSQSAATIQFVCEKAIGYNNVSDDTFQMLIKKHLAILVDRPNAYDVVHNHILEALSVAAHLSAPIVTTLHNNLSYPTEQKFLTQYKAKNSLYISISDSQRQPLPHLPYIRTIYHGIPVHEFPFQEQIGEYFMFLGRIIPEKGLEAAIDVAEQTQTKLKVAAKVDEPLSDYARSMIERMKNNPYVEFIGQVGEEKKKLLAHARALLMPIQWDEPFGLVVIEALATGTPVIAFKRGAMPEIIEEGKTGFIVNSTEEMVMAAQKIGRLDRHYCRRSTEKRFSVDRMVDEYEKVFQEVIKHHP